MCVWFEFKISMCLNWEWMVSVRSSPTHGFDINSIVPTDTAESTSLHLLCLVVPVVSSKLKTPVIFLLANDVVKSRFRSSTTTSVDNQHLYPGTITKPITNPTGHLNTLSLHICRAPYGILNCQPNPVFTTKQRMHLTQWSVQPSCWHSMLQWAVFLSCSHLSPHQLGADSPLLTPSSAGLSPSNRRRLLEYTGGVNLLNSSLQT